MDLRLVRYFLAIVENGGFTSAATALYIAQPSLSHAIRSLEHSLGTELFVRHPKGVTLTPAGQALLGPARQIVRDFDLAHDAVDQVLGLEGGTVTVAVPSWMTVHPVAGLIGQLRREHPAVSCVLIEPEDDGDLISLVADGTCELGFMYARPELESAFRRRHLEYEALAEHEYELVAPPGYLFPEGGVPWSSLAALPWIAPPPGGPVRELIMDFFSQSGVQVEAKVVTDVRNALVGLVLAGAGVTILPLEQAEEARRQGAVVRPLSPELRRPYGVVHRSGLLSAATQVLRHIAISSSRNQG